MRKTIMISALLLMVLLPVQAEPVSTGGIVISEVLVSVNGEGFDDSTDWNGDGVFGSESDQFVELWNSGTSEIDISGWWLDDVNESGSQPCRIVNGTIVPADGRVVIFRADSNIALSWYVGDSVIISDDSGTQIDRMDFPANDSLFGKSFIPNASGTSLDKVEPPTPGSATTETVNGNVSGISCETPIDESDISVADIQQGNVAEDSTVALRNVVITSQTMTMNDKGKFHIQDLGGGDYSGILVYVQSGSYEAVIGDTIDLTGIYVEYYELSELKVNAADIVANSTATPVASQISTTPADWEVYEGCLVTISETTVNDVVDNFGEVSLSIGVKMDNEYFDHSTEPGDVINVSGIITYTYSAFKINPRSGSDLSGENVTDLGNTVKAIQKGMIPAGTEVNLTGLIVTAETKYGAFYVQDVGGGAYTGILVKVDDGWANVIVGDEVSLIGTVAEFYGRSQINMTDLSKLDITGSGTLVATTVSSQPTNWEPYEGCLVTILGTKATTGEDQYGQAELNYDILMDDVYYDFDINPGQSFTSITGPIDFNYGKFTILPRTQADLVEGTGTDGGTDAGGDNGDDDTGTGTNGTDNVTGNNDDDYDPFHRDLSGSDDGGQDSGALLIVMIAIAFLAGLIGGGMYLLNNSGKSENEFTSLEQASLIESDAQEAVAADNSEQQTDDDTQSEEEFVPALPSGPPPK
jgi:hypothetical protein